MTREERDRFRFLFRQGNTLCMEDRITIHLFDQIDALEKERDELRNELDELQEGYQMMIEQMP